MPEKSDTSKTRLLTVKEIPGTDELFLELTPDFLCELGWLVGDELRWEMSEMKNEASIVNVSKGQRDEAARVADEGIKW